MAYSHQGVEYVSVMGSDLDRDGMYLEITKSADRKRILVEIFYSDETAQMTMTVAEPDLPLEVIEWAIATAKQTLPPTHVER